MRIAKRKLGLALVAYLVLIAAIALLLMQEAQAQNVPSPVMSVEDAAAEPSPPNKIPPKTDEKSTSKAADDDLENQSLDKPVDPNEEKSLGATKTPDSSLGSDALMIFIYLGLIVALIVVSLIVFKKFLPGGNRLFQSKVIEVLGRTVIAPKQGLFLIKIADRILLVGSTGTAINTLCEITDPDEMLKIKEIAGSATSGVSDGLSSAFRSMLGRKRGEFDETEPVKIASGKAKGEMGKIKNMISNWREKHSD